MAFPALDDSNGDGQMRQNASKLPGELAQLEMTMQISCIVNFVIYFTFFKDVLKYYCKPGRWSTLDGFFVISRDLINGIKCHLAVRKISTHRFATMAFSLRESSKRGPRINTVSFFCRLAFSASKYDVRWS